MMIGLKKGFEVRDPMITPELKHIPRTNCG
jgi:hypothetical protein